MINVNALFKLENPHKGKTTNADYAKMFKISRNTITNDLSNLVKKDLIKRVGKSKRNINAP